MRKALLAAALALAGSSTAGADPSSRAALWVLPEDFSGWEALPPLLDRFPKNRLTLAVPPEDLPDSLAPWLRENILGCRLEIALRLDGDPLFPLAENARPSDMIERLASAKILYRRKLGLAPAGFVPAAGALDEGSLKLLSSQRFDWIATGGCLSTAPWALAGKTVLVPFSTLVEGSRAALIEGPDQNALPDLWTREPDRDWATVSEAFPLASALSGIPGIDPSTAPPTGWSADLREGLPFRTTTETLYGKAAAVLSAYQDSGQAVLDRLNKAGTALYAARSARFHGKAASSDPALAEGFKARIKEVFSAVRRPLPTELSASWTLGPASGLDARVRSSFSEGRLSFENAPLTPGASEQTAPHPRTLEVSWTQSTVSFLIALEGLGSSPDSPLGIGPLMLDLYIDMNHLPGRGAVDLLPGRKAYVGARDAWEYAVVVDGRGAELYRSLAGQPPTRVDKIKTVSLEDDGRLRVTLPRNRLRGNPAGWGYLLVLLRTDPDGAAGSPPRPIETREPPILGLLGPARTQAALNAPGTDHLRLEMIRRE